MNTADYIVKKLEELGVNEFFGVTGDYNFNIINAVEDNPGTRWIGCTNELNAGYCADGYARERGYGALITNYGSGELSAMSAVAGSFAENVPLVHIAGLPSTKCIESKMVMHNNFQNADYKVFLRAYENVTASAALLNRDNAKLEIDKAFKILVKEKKPVYLAIPMDIAKMEISERYVPNDWESDKNSLNEVAEQIAKRIDESKNPVVLGDVLIKRFDAKIEYKEFVSKLSVPTTNFIMGANIINSDYEKYVGGYFADFKNPIAKKYVDESDCLISVGVIYSDINSFGFNIPFKLNDHVAIYGTYSYVSGKRYDNVKMSDVLQEVTKLVNTRTNNVDKPNIEYKHKYAESEPLNSDYLYGRLQEFVKENDILIIESGITTSGVAQMKFPNNVNIEFQTLWCGSGWSTSAAFGISLAKPNSRVIIITGEGAHQHTILEIGNMIRNGAKPIVIVVNNNGYAANRILSGKPEDKIHDTVQINYAKFARAFEGDIWATKVTNCDDFDKALKVTQIMNKLCYIELSIEKMDMPKLAHDILRYNAEKMSSESIPKSICSKNTDYDAKSDNEFSTSCSGNFVYETTVHKKFIESNEDKE